MKVVNNIKNGSNGNAPEVSNKFDNVIDSSWIVPINFSDWIPSVYFDKHNNQLLIANVTKPLLSASSRKKGHGKRKKNNNKKHVIAQHPRIECVVNVR